MNESRRRMNTTHVRRVAASYWAWVGLSVWSTNLRVTIFQKKTINIQLFIQSIIKNIRLPSGGRGIRSPFVAYPIRVKVGLTYHLKGSSGCNCQGGWGQWSSTTSTIHGRTLNIRIAGSGRGHLGVSSARMDATSQQQHNSNQEFHLL